MEEDVSHHVQEDAVLCGLGFFEETVRKCLGFETYIQRGLGKNTMMTSITSKKDHPNILRQTRTKHLETMHRRSQWGLVAFCFRRVSLHSQRLAVETSQPGAVCVDVPLGGEMMQSRIPSPASSCPHATRLRPFRHHPDCVSPKLQTNVPNPLRTCTPPRSSYRFGESVMKAGLPSRASRRPWTIDAAT